MLCCQVKSTRWLFMHSFFSTHIQVSEVLDTVLHNTDAVPAFMKLRGEQRSQREERAEEW